MTTTDVQIVCGEGALIGVVKDRVLHLLSLSVHEGSRGRGVGTALLRELAKWCRLNGMRRIDVDDMSTRQRCARNVYVLAGFAYRAPIGPEMYASPASVQRCTDGRGSDCVIELQTIPETYTR